MIYPCFPSFIWRTRRKIWKQSQESLLQGKSLLSHPCTWLQPALSSAKLHVKFPTAFQVDFGILAFQTAPINSKRKYATKTIFFMLLLLSGSVVTAVAALGNVKSSSELDVCTWKQFCWKELDSCSAKELTSMAQLHGIPNGVQTSCSSKKLQAARAAIFLPECGKICACSLCGGSLAAFIQVKGCCNAPSASYTEKDFWFHSSASSLQSGTPFSKWIINEFHLAGPQAKGIQ